MSILLESLKQQKNNSDDMGVPNIADSHFDDEMLSDEWLLDKLKIWKIISGMIFIILVATFLFFVSYASESERKAELLEERIVALDSQLEILSRKIKLEQKTTEQKSQEVSISSQIEKANKKQPYKPQIISSNPVDSRAPSPEPLDTDKNINGRVEKNGNIASNNSEVPIDFEHLSEEQRAQLPELTISSFAVSSNPKKSFVVLNGNFYGEGETIAPHLVLVNIFNKSIVVRYRDTLIRKKIGQ